MKKRRTIYWKRTICSLALTFAAITWPGVAFAEGDVKEFRGRFEVYVEGKKKTGAVWSKRIKNVRLIRLGRNFLVFATKDAGYSYHQSTVDAFIWKAMKPEEAPTKEAPAKRAPVKVKTKKKYAEQLAAKIDELHTEMTDMIDRSELDGLMERFERLDKLLEDYSVLGEASRKKLAEWKQRRRAGAFEQVKKIMQLETFLYDGREILRDMASDLKENKNGRVIRTFADIEKLCAEMRAFKDARFHRNAKALYEKAKELKKKASKKLQDK